MCLRLQGLVLKLLWKDVKEENIKRKDNWKHTHTHTQIKLNFKE